MNKTIKLTVFLAIIAALATGVLAAVNSLTAPIIAANESDSQTAELKALYPDATNFTAVDFTDDTGLVQEAYAVDDTAHVFKVSSRGYSSDIGFLIGYNNDGSNSKFKILSNDDTPGFGQRLMEDSYHDAMTGKATSDAVEMLSGATATSKAIKNGVDSAVKVFNALTGSTATPEAPAEPEAKKLVVGEMADGSIKSSNQEGDVITYEITAPGFYDTNVIEVVIDLASRTVTSARIKGFNDTEGIGDLANAPEFLDQLTGMSIDDDAFAVDVATGATFTSESVVSGIKTAIQDARGK